MTDPISFTSTTPRYGLPLLFAGQSQKEFYVNEAHALADALLRAACEGESADPPATPAEGETWLVASAATGDWAGADGKIASRQSGNWLFAVPADGMRMFDQYVSPWVTMVEDAKFQATVDRVAVLRPTAMAGCHTPAILGDRVERALAITRTAPTAVVPPQPDQSVLEQIQQTLTVAA